MACYTEPYEKLLFKTVWKNAGILKNTVLDELNVRKKINKKSEKKQPTLLI